MEVDHLSLEDYLKTLKQFRADNEHQNWSLDESKLAFDNRLRNRGINFPDYLDPIDIPYKFEPSELSKRGAYYADKPESEFVFKPSKLSERAAYNEKSTSKSNYDESRHDAERAKEKQKAAQESKINENREREFAERRQKAAAESKAKQEAEAKAKAEAKSKEEATAKSQADEKQRELEQAYLQKLPEILKKYEEFKQKFGNRVLSDDVKRANTKYRRDLCLLFHPDKAPEKFRDEATERVRHVIRILGTGKLKKTKKEQTGGELFELDYSLPTKAAQIVQQKNGLNIIAFTIMRTPVNSLIQGAANFLTLGGINKIKKDVGGDLYHLFSVLTLEDGSKFLLEKNDRINLTSSLPDDNTKTQSCPCEIKIPQTLDQLMSNMKQRMGPKNFFTYDAFENNCQDFLKAAVTCLGGLTKQADTFIKQSISKSAASINPISKNLVKGITNAGNWVNTLKDNVMNAFESDNSTQRPPTLISKRDPRI